VQAVSPIFRATFAKLARAAVPGIKLPEAIWEKDWNVHSRPCSEGPRQVLQYLARYVFRGPMSGRRISDLDDGRYTIKYRDNETRRWASVRLEPDEFLRRYLQHTLPRGFHKVRYFGWWSPSCRLKLRQLQLQLGPGLTDLAEEYARDVERWQENSKAQHCPYCGSTHSHVIGHVRKAPYADPSNRGPPP